MHNYRTTCAVTPCLVTKVFSFETERSILFFYQYFFLEIFLTMEILLGDFPEYHKLNKNHFRRMYREKSNHPAYFVTKTKNLKLLIRLGNPKHEVVQ